MTTGKVEPTVEDLSEQVRVRIEKMEKIRARGDNPYRNGLTPDTLADALHREWIGKTKEELEALAQPASVAGRIMAIRDFGKASFARIRDRSGLMQIYVQKDKLGEAEYAKFREL
ncbi:MAG: OB-fold nucleic acid binding domain-containing protein, partial [Bdellovibrionota bacterium]